MHNSTVVGIACRGNGFEWVFFAWLVVISMHIGNADLCGVGGWHNKLWSMGGNVKLISSLLVLTLALF